MYRFGSAERDLSGFVFHLGVSECRKPVFVGDELQFTEVRGVAGWLMVAVPLQRHFEHQDLKIDCPHAEREVLQILQGCLEVAWHGMRMLGVKRDLPHVLRHGFW